MPHRRPPGSRANVPPPARGNFRLRYKELETQRTELAARLHTLGQDARQHPGYKRALRLLNDTFRKSKLAQRLAVLQAASWLIDLLEQITTVV